MANIKSAVKRAKQADASHKRNKAGKSRVLTARKKVLAAIESGNKDEATKAFSAYTSVLDKTAKKGIIARNNASRKKSRMATSISKLG
ncbi:MAG: 30S ribosomal protein S20 [bacterium]|jgi:small subunit ribosomal protein S20